MSDLVLYFSIKYEGNFNKIYKALLNKENFDKDVVIKMKEQLDCQYITIFDDEYPDELKEINCPPFVLFYKGNINLLKEKKLCLVSLENNHSTKLLLDQFIKDMINKDEFVLIRPDRSCLLDCRIKTIKITDRGISFYNDIENKDTLIISEYPNFVDPPKKNLPFSYRIVSGLANKVVLAQCYDTNEEVMTIAYAIEQNKDMYLIGNEFELFEVFNPSKIKHIENYNEI